MKSTSLLLAGWAFVGVADNVPHGWPFLVGGAASFFFSLLAWMVGE